MQHQSRLSIISSHFGPFATSQATDKHPTIGDNHKEYPVIVDHKPHHKVNLHDHNNIRSKLIQTISKDGVMQTQDL